jgi:hypothetical protein
LVTVIRSQVAGNLYVHAINLRNRIWNISITSVYSILFLPQFYIYSNKQKHSTYSKKNNYKCMEYFGVGLIIVKWTISNSEDVEAF